MKKIDLLLFIPANRGGNNVNTHASFGLAIQSDLDFVNLMGKQFFVHKIEFNAYFTKSNK